MMETINPSNRNLQQKAFTQAVIYFWIHHKMKSALKEFFMEKSNYETAIEKKSFFVRNLMKENAFLFNVHIPRSYSDEIKYAIHNLGYRIFEYLYRIQKRIINVENYENIISTYVDNLIFTCMGLIDSAAIFKKVFDEKLVDEASLLYHQACNCCLEDYIIKVKKRYPVEIRKIIASFDEEETSYPEKMSHTFERHFLYLIDERIEQSMMTKDELLKASAYEGNVAGVKYFLRLEDEDGKFIFVRSLIFSIMETVWEQSILWRTHSDVIISVIFETQPPKDHASLLMGIIFGEESPLALFQWPWVDHILRFIEVNFSNYDNLFYKIVDILSKTNKGDITTMDIDEIPIYMKIWDLCTRETKIALFKSEYFLRRIFWSIPDFVRVINDPDLEGIKKRILDHVIICLFEECDKENQEKNFRELKKEANFCETDNKIFEDKFNAVLKCQAFMENMEYPSAQNVLTEYFSDSDCRNEIKGILWRLIPDGEIIMWKIWTEEGKNLENRSKLTKEFIEFRPEWIALEISLRHLRENVKPKSSLLKVLEFQVLNQNFVFYHAILDACMIHDNLRFEFRKMIFKRIGKMSCMKYIENREIENLERLLDWNFECFFEWIKQKRRKEFLNRFFRTGKGITACMNSINHHSYRDSDAENIIFFNDLTQLLTSRNSINCLLSVMERPNNNILIPNKNSSVCKLFMKALHSRYLKLRRL